MTLARVKRLLLCGAAVGSLFVLPAAADEIGNLLRSMSGHASGAAEAQAAIEAAKENAAKDAAAKDAPTAAPAIVPPAPVPVERPAQQPATAAASDPAPVMTAAAHAPASPEPAAAAPVTAPSPDKKPADPKADTKDAAHAAKPAKPPLPAKQLFAAAKSPAPLAARSIGWYAKGCIAGAKPLPVNGPAWQVMRLSRNRYWGHPNLISLLERLANESKEKNEWPGLLIGDISQPRGGPMLTGHASHQVGLDADIWLTPMPARELSEREREDISATSMLAANEISVDPKVFGDGQVKLIKRAASYANVERVLVHPAIKKALCEAAGTDRGWLSKVRPYFGHYYHFHMRIGCPEGSAGCTAQHPVPGDDGCGTELTDWIKRITPKPKTAEAKPAPKPDTKPEPKKEILLSDLPADCKAVLTAGGNVPPTEAVMVDSSKDAGPADPQPTTAQAAAQ